MNPSKSSEDIIKGLFPVLIILIVLIVGIIAMPKLSGDSRSRASEPKNSINLPRDNKSPTPNNPRPTFPPMNTSNKPEIVCSDLYSPVCDPKTDITYANTCEANLAGVLNTTKGACKTNTKAPISLPNSN